MPGAIANWLLGLPIPWLVGLENGKAYWTGVGGVLDNQVDQLKQAAKACLPELAPADALPHLSSEYQILQGAAESNATFATRLKTSISDQWPWAGAALGVLVQLYHQGYTSCILVQQNGLAYYLTGAPGSNPTTVLGIAQLGGYPGITGDPPWWTFSTRDDLTARWALVLPSVPSQWTNVQDPPTATSSPSVNDIQVIYSIADTFGPKKALFQGLYLATAGSCWGWPVVTWGSDTWDSVSTVHHF